MRPTSGQPRSRWSARAARAARIVVVALAGLVGLAGAVGLAGCRFHSELTEPIEPEQPVTVYILDFGYHASLVLPTRRGLVEYSYGDRSWFTFNRVGLDAALSTVFGYTHATFGRREIAGPATLANVREHTTAVPQAVVVSQIDVDLLAASLDAEYERMAAFEAPVLNPQVSMNFVRGREKYTILKNCNHRVLLWLKMLGCEIESAAPWADFRVRRAE